MSEELEGLHWYAFNDFRHYLLNSDGKVVGLVEISRDVLWKVSYASGSSIGDYILLDQAKAALLKALAPANKDEGKDHAP
jgi:hypothetical protein